MAASSTVAVTYSSLEPNKTYAILKLPPAFGDNKDQYVTFTARDTQKLFFNKEKPDAAQPADFQYPIERGGSYLGSPVTFTWQLTGTQENMAWTSSGVSGVTTIMAMSTESSISIKTSAPVSPGKGLTSTQQEISMTTPLPTSTQSPTDRPSDSQEVLSGGAVAGVAVGCLLAGALISGLVFWFCLRRSKTRHGIIQDREASEMVLMSRGKSANAKILSLESDSGMTTTIESSVPQPLEDKAISGEISKISNSIKNHVQSFYHSGRVSPGLIDYDDLQALGRELPISIGTLSTLLGNSTTRETALRFCIAWVVVSRMSPENAPNFLPPEVASCFQSISPTNNADKAQALSLAKWRAITAEQLQTNYVKDAFSPNDARLQNLQDALRVLDQILVPYSDSRLDNEQRGRNLEEILKRAAIFALTLFSQPSTWDFDWKNDDSVKKGSFCVFPSLVQVMNEKGDMVRPPQPFSEAVIRRLDE